MPSFCVLDGLDCTSPKKTDMGALMSSCVVLINRTTASKSIKVVALSSAVAVLVYLVISSLFQPLIWHEEWVAGAKVFEQILSFLREEKHSGPLCRGARHMGESVVGPLVKHLWGVA